MCPSTHAPAGILSVRLTQAVLPPLFICSSQSIPSDPALSFVTSQLGAPTEVAAQQQQQPTALTPGSSGGSGALELRSEARVWEVQWQELKLQRLLGRGSFGSVYLAEWNQVPVAVKMLGGKGERGRKDCMESTHGCNGGGQHDWRLPHTRPAVFDSHVCLCLCFLQTALTSATWSCQTGYCKSCRPRRQ